VFGMNFWTLGNCAACKGDGVIGYFQGNAIYCEKCYGSGYEWIEHCFTGD
jgi:hypothetical protein